MNKFVPLAGLDRVKLTQNKRIAELTTPLW